jgi:hypothetical protein
MRDFDFGIVSNFFFFGFHFHLGYLVERWPETKIKHRKSRL